MMDVAGFAASQVAQMAPWNRVNQAFKSGVGRVAEFAGRQGANPYVTAAALTPVAMAPEILGTYAGLKGIYNSTNPTIKGFVTFPENFSDVDSRGARHTLQDLSFSGSLSFYQGERVVRVLEPGVGHSESDVVVHLPGEKIVLCGALFLNGMPPLPGEGHVSHTIANYKAIEALETEIYVAGHGDSGNPGRCARPADPAGTPVSAPGNVSSRA